MYHFIVEFIDFQQGRTVGKTYTKILRVKLKTNPIAIITDNAAIILYLADS